MDKVQPLSGKFPRDTDRPCETQRRVELAALQITFERFTQDPIPPLHRIQLLRSLTQLRNG